MMRTIWILLFGLIYASSEISFGDCAPVKEKLKTSFIAESKIRIKRKFLEQQHHINYMNNDAIYRNWPEVHENVIHNCRRFLQKIFPVKVDLAATATPKIVKVILNYKQIRDEDNNIMTPKRVTALECKLGHIMWSRRFIYFIRSPQSPKCALCLNRIGKRTANFYIVENICDYKAYRYFRKYIHELEEDKSEVRKSSTPYMRRLSYQLPVEEIKAKHAEFEQRHHEYCSTNPVMCTLWPEVRTVLKSECQRFLKRILPLSVDLSSLVATSHQVKLRYSEIRDKNKGKWVSVVVNMLGCQLVQHIQNRKYFCFVRAPSFPHCVFYIIKKLLITEFFYIAEEVCDTPNHKVALSTILLESAKVSKFSKKIKLPTFETFEKLRNYEKLHYQDYSIKQSQYEEWHELNEMNKESYCQKIIVNLLFPYIADKFGIYKFTTESGLVGLKYATNETIPLREVKTLECIEFERSPPNRFRFIRSPKINCVYWIRRQCGPKNYYFIAREFCMDDKELSNTLGINFNNDYYPESIVPLLNGEEVIDHLFEHVF